VVSGVTTNSIGMNPHHHVRHAGGAAQRGGEIAQSTVDLVRDRVLQDFLILRNERCLLAEPPRLGLVVRRMSGKFNGNPYPRTASIGVFRVLGRVSPDRHRQRGGQAARIATDATGLHWRSGYTAGRRRQRACAASRATRRLRTTRTGPG
jgi:hypothetical protein